MELDELKTAWRALDGRVEAVRALNLNVLRELKLARAASALRRLAWLPLIDLAGAVVAALLLGSFLAEHFRTTRVVIPALVLHVAAVLTIVSSAVQLAMIRRIDYSAPVVTMQKALTELRTWRIRTVQWQLLLAPLLWTPLVIVAAQGLFGFDIYRWFGPLYVAANVGVGLALIPLMIWAARRFTDRFQHSSIVKSLADDVAGRSLATARGVLDEIARFEKGE